METDLFIYVSAHRDLEENGWVSTAGEGGLRTPRLVGSALSGGGERRGWLVCGALGVGFGHITSSLRLWAQHMLLSLPDPESSGREPVTRALLYDKDTFRFWGGREMIEFTVRVAHRALPCGFQGTLLLRSFLLRVVGATSSWEFQAVRVAKPVGFLGNERLVNQAKGPQGVKPCLSRV